MTRTHTRERTQTHTHIYDLCDVKHFEYQFVLGRYKEDKECKRINMYYRRRENSISANVNMC